MSYLPELFSTILDMSITASLVIIGVVLVRMCLRKAPKVFSYALWTVVLFRLLCPLSFTSAFSFLGLLQINSLNNAGVWELMPNAINTAPASTVPAGLDNLEQVLNPSLPSSAAIASANPMPTAIELLSIIWLLGVVALLAYSVVSYIKVRKKLFPATLLKGNIYQSDQIGTAFVCGFIQPRIYVPAGVKEADLPYILEHEGTHIRRKDYLIKPLAFLVLIMHWFNPLVWWSFFLMSRDMEMSCDESVLNRLGNGAKAAYSSSLLSLSVSRSALPAANPLAFGESNIKARIKNVLNYKQPGFWVIIIAVLAVGLSVMVFTANPGKQEIDELDPIRSLAWEVMERDIANYELDPEIRIIDQKITRLELLKVFEALGDTPIHVYALEYRLLPEDLSKVVLAGGMDVDEDGWLKETCSMGSPLLVVSINNGSMELAGIVWTGESQELESAVKDLLAAKDLKRAETEKLVEENLSIIMSSPKEASNPFAYIRAHEQEYVNIQKYGGEEALQYMLAQFEKGNAEGLRGAIMMQLSKELLGLRNNVTDDTLSPMEWYQALDIIEDTLLPDFQYDGPDTIEKLVYAAEIEQNSGTHLQGFTIVAPKIFGSYEEGKLLRVFATTYSGRYRLYGKVLDQVGGSVVPAAITYKKDKNGNYVLLDYLQSQDGAHWAPSIREFCRMPLSGQEIPGLADTIIGHYADYDDLRQLHFDNLYKHLAANGIREATLTNSRGEIQFSMSWPDRL
jgi:beta-lactamase regulating signal transducer with metallopeptidase domain